MRHKNDTFHAPLPLRERVAGEGEIHIQIIFGIIS